MGIKIQNVFDGTPSEEKKPACLREGVNRFHILSPLYGDVTLHYVEWGVRGRKYVDCIADKGCCPICMKGVKPTKRRAFYVLDRADSQIKLCELPFKAAKEIEDLLQEGHLPQHDVLITKVKGIGTTHYDVQLADEATPLTEDEKALRDEFIKSNPIASFYAEATKDSLQDLADNLNPEYLDRLKQPRPTLQISEVIESSPDEEFDLDKLSW
jgi:hypothetical protein